MQNRPVATAGDSGARSGLGDRPGGGCGDLDRFFDLSTDLLCIVGFDGLFRRLSASWSELLGYSIEELLAAPVEHFLHPDDRARTASHSAHQIETGAVDFSFENRYQHADGTYRQLSWNASADTERRLVFAVARHQDPRIVAELTAQREEAQQAGAFSAAALAASPDALLVNDLDNASVRYLSRTAEALLGAGLHFGDRNADSDVHPEDRARLADAIVACSSLKEDQVLKIRYRVRDGSGGYRWLSRRFTSFRRGTDGRTCEALSVVRDITEVVASEQRLSHAALHDVLTGLPNRTLLADRLGGALARAQRLRQDVAVLYCDLDGFKSINDTSGHATGDIVLKQTALRLQVILRTQDTVARVGGDEFVIIVEAGDGSDRQSDPAELGGTTSGEVSPSRKLGLHVARRVIAALAVPIEVDGGEHAVSVSVGVAFAGGPGNTRTPEEVLRNADAAMYRAKALGKDRYELFDNGSRAEDVEQG